MSAIVELKAVGKSYGDPPTRVLDDVSLSIDQGEFVAVVGPSGSGKSTMLNLIGTLDRPTTGSVVIDGSEVESLSDDELSAVRAHKLGFIFQQFHLADNVRAVDNVADGLLYTGVPKAQRRRRAVEALERVGLSHRLTHRPQQLSGGERQRVAIARALVGEPPILLADEPTGNLDSRSGDGIFQLLLDLNASGSTVVMITHDNQLAAIVPRQVHIRDGRISADSRKKGKEWLAAFVGRDAGAYSLSVLRRGNPALDARGDGGRCLRVGGDRAVCGYQRVATLCASTRVRGGHRCNSRRRRYCGTLPSRPSGPDTADSSARRLTVAGLRRGHLLDARPGQVTAKEGGAPWRGGLLLFLSLTSSTEDPLTSPSEARFEYGDEFGALLAPVREHAPDRKVSSVGSVQSIPVDLNLPVERTGFVLNGRMSGLHVGFGRREGGDKNHPSCGESGNCIRPRKQAFVTD